MLIFVADAVLFLWWYTAGVEIKAPLDLTMALAKGMLLKICLVLFKKERKEFI